MAKIGWLFLALAAAGGLAGCAVPGVGGGDYGRGQVQGEQSVRLATVMSVRQVRIEGTHSGLGGLAGAVVGGVAGSTAGGGRGNGLATAAGAVVGGLAGSALEQGSTRQLGVEVTLQYDNGKLSAITQGADESFKVGDRVVVTSGGGVTRVTKVAAGSALNTLPPPANSAPSSVPPLNSAPPSGAGSLIPPPGSAPAPGAGADLVPPPGSAPSARAEVRWYCPEQGYYPTVATCTQKWLKVAQ
jgi:outer membrane lipoprotein SlyB